MVVVEANISRWENAGSSKGKAELRIAAVAPARIRTLSRGPKSVNGRLPQDHDQDSLHLPMLTSMSPVLNSQHVRLLGRPKQSYITDARMVMLALNVSWA